ncbi:MAG: YkuS family protein [bacterium]|nr:YkuS family protein [bacterium]
MPGDRIVAVEEALSDVSAALSERGYRVVDLDQETSAGILVLSGQDTDVTGVRTTDRSVPVVVARGRTAREVADEVDRRYPLAGPLH